ncbi:cytochrome c biogenesis protein CcsA, partial [Weizmannia coagulans]|nr:cytochrome c biogenesis protein CcsA [Heyndrickxia coagulans]
VLQSASFLSVRNYYRAQFIQQLDRWGYRVISLGFLFLTIGILSGAVWANEAWGSYWSWDPKETWAFITWTIFAIYLHTRTNRNFQVKNSALVASMG